MYEPIVPDILFKQARDILICGHHDQMLRPKCTTRVFGIGTHLFFLKKHHRSCPTTFVAFSFRLSYYKIADS